MNQIIPAILAKDEQEFRSRLALIKDTTDAIQIDVLDNTLYPNTSWCDMDVIDSLDDATWIELHFMVNNPVQYIEHIKRGGPIHRALWHIEAPIDHGDLIETCRNIGIEVGLAIAPRTSIEALQPFADQVDEILVLGVDPGFSGQPLIPHTIQTARDLYARFPSCIIGFDGGITPQNLPDLRAAGVTRFCVGSAIWKNKNSTEALEQLQNA